jgi:hypothetical protein
MCLTFTFVYILESEEHKIYHGTILRPIVSFFFFKLEVQKISTNHYFGMKNNWFQEFKLMLSFKNTQHDLVIRM